MVFTYRENYCKIIKIKVATEEIDLELKYKRVLLKLSGEVLAGETSFGLDYNVVQAICKSIKRCTDLGAEIGIVVGGGNFWRGRSSGEMDRTRADHMGMLATVINALALADAFEKLDCDVRVMTALPMQSIAEPYIRNRAVHHLNKGKIVIFGAGTGNPFFSTDTASTLRAAEIDADIIFKATNVDGVYDSDPNKNANAKKFDELSFKEMINRELKVMDSTAASMCRDNNMPILVFNVKDPDNIYRAITGEKIGTIVTMN